MTRDEIKFYNFINRLRANFKELIVKPLKLQMLIEFPELKEDEIVMNQIDISFNSNQVFEEWKKLNNLSKKAEIFGTLVAIMNGEKPYFHIEYLIDNVFKLTPEEKAENQKYWAKDAASVAAAAAAAPAAEGAAPAEGGDVPAEGGEAAPAEGGEAAPEAQAAPETPPAESGSEFEF
jgi:hypothetical protein